MDEVRAIPEILVLAYERGQLGTTFATFAEQHTFGYDAAWALGDEYRRGRVVEPHTLCGCGCPRCRLERVTR